MTGESIAVLLNAITVMNMTSYMVQLVFVHTYYDYCDSWENQIPFEADTIEAAEYQLFQTQEFNITKPDKLRSFCGFDVFPDDEQYNCKIYTLDEWFARNKREMDNLHSEL